jgi:hypothetical protein
VPPLCVTACTGSVQGTDMLDTHCDYHLHLHEATVPTHTHALRTHSVQEQTSKAYSVLSISMLRSFTHAAGTTAAACADLDALAAVKPQALRWDPQLARLLAFLWLGHLHLNGCRQAGARRTLGVCAVPVNKQPLPQTHRET